MNTRKKETKERCKVSVSRVEPQQLAVTEQAPLVCLPVLTVGTDLAGSTAISKRPTAEMSRSNSTRTAAVPRVRIRLDEGAVTVNGKKLTIPTGLAGTMAGRELKKIAGIYRGNLLFVRVNGGMQRIKDNETVEFVDGKEFRHERTVPRFSSTSSLSRD